MIRFRPLPYVMHVVAAARSILICCLATSSMLQEQLQHPTQHFRATKKPIEGFELHLNHQSVFLRSLKCDERFGRAAAAAAAAATTTELKAIARKQKKSPLVLQQDMLRMYLCMSTYVSLLPDRTFHNFRSVKSRDWQALCSLQNVHRRISRL